MFISFLTSFYYDFITLKESRAIHNLYGEEYQTDHQSQDINENSDLKVTWQYAILRWKMLEQERISQLNFISTTHRALHEQRQRIEIRVIIITLSTFGLSTFAFLKGDLKLTLFVGLKLVIWITFLTLAIVSVLYLRRIHIANRTNIQIAEAAEDEIINSIGLTKAQEFTRKGRARTYWSWGWQATIVFLVALASALIITV